MDETKRNFEYFKANLNSICSKRLGDFVVIYDCKPTRYFRNPAEAVKWAMEKYGLGRFILQKCVESLDDDMTVIHSPFVLAGIGNLRERQMQNAYNDFF